MSARLDEFASSPSRTETLGLNFTGSLVKDCCVQPPPITPLSPFEISTVRRIIFVTSHRESILDTCTGFLFPQLGCSDAEELFTTAKGSAI
ncbi:MAG: hypothetical protein ACUVSC_12625 [Candidatus Fervidibacter sp.]|uniref:hypothetical protein n=1 Tax=Candidatus Fervidibacter sp. TaxID=3100871 RepID=UPI00404B2FCF